MSHDHETLPVALNLVRELTFGFRTGAELRHRLAVVGLVFSRQLILYIRPVATSDLFRAGG